MRRPQQGRLRLRLKRIECKPKEVRLQGWQDYAGVGKNPVLREELDHIIERIGRGEGVAEAHYRAGIDEDKDALLEESGILHLHLGGRHSDTLIFLVQYADMVLLLESNSHVHFRTTPKGKNISALVQAWFVNLEREMEASRRAAIDAATETARVLAEERRDALAASLAKLRRDAGKA